LRAIALNPDRANQCQILHIREAERLSVSIDDNAELITVTVRGFVSARTIRQCHDMAGNLGYGIEFHDARSGRGEARP
jgi:hypothetical protein